MDHLELPVFFEDLRKIATRVEEISCALDEGKSVDTDGLDFKVSPRLFFAQTLPLNVFIEGCRRGTHTITTTPPPAPKLYPAHHEITC